MRALAWNAQVKTGSSIAEEPKKSKHHLVDREKLPFMWWYWRHRYRLKLLKTDGGRREKRF